MSKIKISPQSIIYSIVGLSLLPKLFSPLGTSSTIVLVLIFWIAPFVLFPELVEGYTSKDKSLSELPKLTLFLSLICIICIVVSFYHREIIYSDTRNGLINIKRSLYLIHPVLYFSLYPLVNKKNKKEFILKFTLLFLTFIWALTVPLVINSIFIGSFLNNLTATLSAYFAGYFNETEVLTDKDTFFSDNFTITVLSGCSAIPQITISLFSSFIMYLCCKIKSKKHILLLILIPIPIIFASNVIRISILAYFVSISKTNTFDFWHTGGGSLIYSFIVMFFTSSLYYYFWTKENPLDEPT